MKRFIRKPMFLIPLMVLICVGLFLSQAQAERVMREVQRKAADIPMTIGRAPVLRAQPKKKLTVIPGILKALCPADDYCQMEKCSTFYHAISFLGGIFKMDSNLNTPNPNSIHIGPTPGPQMGSTIEWTCIGFPRDVWDDVLHSMYNECAAGMGSFSNTACKNPYKEQQNYNLVFYVDAGDIANLNSSIQTEYGTPNFFNAANIVPICVNPNFNLITQKEACENNCCFE